MHHHLIFTGSGPIVIIHTYDDISDPMLAYKLEAKGIRKFIAFALDGDELKNNYGRSYDTVIEDLHDQNDLRVLDYDGHRILKRFDFNQLKTQKPFFHEKQIA